MKESKIMIRRLSESGQHGYLVYPDGMEYWLPNREDGHQFDSMATAVQAAALLELDCDYDYVEFAI